MSVVFGYDGERYAVLGTDTLTVDAKSGQTRVDLPKLQAWEGGWISGTGSAHVLEGLFAVLPVALASGKGDSAIEAKLKREADARAAAITLTEEQRSIYLPGTRVAFTAGTSDGCMICCFSPFDTAKLQRIAKHSAVALWPVDYEGTVAGFPKPDQAAPVMTQAIQTVAAISSRIREASGHSEQVSSDVDIGVIIRASAGLDVCRFRGPGGEMAKARSLADLTQYRTA